MHSNLFIFLWRRKLSVLLISCSLILLALWTWAYLEADNREASGQILYDFSDVDNNNNKQAFLLQRLIAQANRVLRYQQKQQVAAESQLPHRPPAAVVRAIKTTDSPAAAVHEASSQTLALVARRKKAPILGESHLFEEERLKILENQQRVRNAVAEDLNSIMLDYERELSSSERQTQYEHELVRMGVPVVAGIGPEGARAPHERLVHLDLKGAPPKLSYLKSLLPMLKQLGATGLLIEYEDMFPYSGALQVLSARNAYKAEELKDFLQSVAMHGLSVMPLVQTFGHMEYVLKLHGFEHIREVPESPQSICPSQQDAISLIENMLIQMIEFHLYAGASANSSASLTQFSHIHIGCDEVYRAGECEKCRQRTRNEIFLTHVTTVASFVRSHWPQLHVVIWDDMLRVMSLTQMQASNIGSYVEPMIWVYSSDIYRFITPHLWDMYARVFPTAWAASAFKGAFGESLMIPPLQRHLENNIRWLAVIAKEGGRFAKGFKGLALTGWQRYDHFAVLCELLPTGMPSLITSLSTVSKGYFSTNPKDNDMLRVLECAFHPDGRRSSHPWIELQPNSHHSQLFASCTYPGSLMYKYALRLYDKLTENQNYLQHAHVKSAWMSDYNVRHNFSAPLQVRGLSAGIPARIDELSAMAREAHQLMVDIYDEHTIAEFIEQNIYPAIVALQQHVSHAQALLQQRTWPQRPLPYARELHDLNLVPAALPAAAAVDQQQLPMQQN